MPNKLLLSYGIYKINVYKRGVKFFFNLGYLSLINSLPPSNVI